MKKCKLLFLLFICFFLTGCSLNYEIEIYNDEVNENISIIYPSYTFNGQSPLKYIDQKSFEYFESTDVLRSRIWNEKTDGIFTKNKYKFKEYVGEIESILNCYDLSKVNNVDGEITILTSDEFKCFDLYPDLENITLKIKSNHKLLETNADRIDKHTYYWDINRDNFNNRKILLKLSSNDYVFNYNNEFLKKVMYIAGFTVIILSVSAVTYYIFKNKVNRLNKI